MNLHSFYSYDFFPLLLLNIVWFIITVWILHIVIRNATREAIKESQEELVYIIRKALFEAKKDQENGFISMSPEMQKLQERIERENKQLSKAESIEDKMKRVQER